MQQKQKVNLNTAYYEQNIFSHNFNRFINNNYMVVPVICVSPFTTKHTWQFPVDNEALDKPNYQRYRWRQYLLRVIE